MTLFLTIIAALNIIAVFFFGKTQRSPLIYIIFWWYFWILISSFSFSRLNTPSAEVYAMYILMLISATFGAFVHYLMRNSSGKIFKPIVSEGINRFEHGAYDLCLRITKYVSTPVVLFYFFKSLIIMSSIDDISLYRDIVFATGEVESAVFGTGSMQFIYALTVGNFIFISVIVGAASFLIERKRRLLIISSVLFCMDGVMMLGRFNFYILLVFLILMLILDGKKKDKYLKYIKNLIFIIPVAMLLIGFQRGADNIENQLKTYVLEYHTLGFSLFNHDYGDKESILNISKNNGFSSFGVVEQMAYVIVRRFDDTVKAGSILVGDSLNDRRLIGENNQIYNAYGTIIYSLYFDYGLFGIFIFPFIWGYALMRSSYLAKRDKSIYQYSLTILLFYISFFGIFQSLLLGSFWVYVIILVFIFKVRLTFKGIKSTITGSVGKPPSAKGGFKSEVQHLIR